MRSNQQVESRIEPRVRPEPTQRSNPFGERESARILRLKQVSAICGDWPEFDLPQGPRRDVPVTHQVGLRSRFRVDFR